MASPRVDGSADTYLKERNLSRRRSRSRFPLPGRPMRRSRRKVFRPLQPGRRARLSPKAIVLSLSPLIRRAADALTA